MDNDHGITGELREYARGYRLTLNRSYQTLMEIADRIDAAHEDALSRLYMDMSNSEWVRLPKDADGKHIHEHDKVDWRDHAGTWHENKTVVAVCSDGCYVLDGIVFHVHKSDIRHHHTHTVEDVLSDFADCLYEKVAYIDEEHVQKAIAEYAAKLRLAGDAE